MPTDPFETLENSVAIAMKALSSAIIAEFPEGSAIRVRVGNGFSFCKSAGWACGGKLQIIFPTGRYAYKHWSLISHAE